MIAGPALHKLHEGLGDSAGQIELGGLRSDPTNLLASHKGLKANQSWPLGIFHILKPPGLFQLLLEPLEPLPLESVEPSEPVSPFLDPVKPLEPPQFL